MEMSINGPLVCYGGSFEMPSVAEGPAAVLAMGRSGGRTSLGDILEEDGWSVTSLDDGWTLLDHLRRSAAMLGAWKPPALVVLEVALMGPRLGVLFGALRALYPHLPVLLVGRLVDRDGRGLLRPPFGSLEVRRAVRRSVGTVAR